MTKPSAHMCMVRLCVFEALVRCTPAISTGSDKEPTPETEGIELELLERRVYAAQ